MEVTIPRGAVSLAAESFGRAGDPPIILAMGATASMLWWPTSLCEALAEDGFRVIRYDHRDTGRSTTCPPGRPDYSVADLADDALAVADAFDAERFHLVGMSLGGLIGQLIAHRHPERILSLTLIASEPLGGDGRPLPSLPPEFLAHFGQMETLNWDDRDAVRTFLLEIARLSASRSHSFDAAREGRRIDAEMDRARDIRSAFNHAMIAEGYDDAPDLRDICTPTLVIHGDEDPILSLAAGRAIAEQIPGADLLVLEGSGHELAERDLDRIREAIVRHARAVGPD